MEQSGSAVGQGLACPQTLSPLFDHPNHLGPWGYIGIIGFILRVYRDYRLYIGVIGIIGFILSLRNPKVQVSLWALPTRALLLWLVAVRVALNAFDAGSFCSRTRREKGLKCPVFGRARS